uniref:ATP synthase epsilon chain n=1 Tax=Candidatus Kentrum sp. DK TaxID=2126562 RepID=A0A450SFX7_9GAMM|nr:MAG: ATP synthase F1 subcomplex epsilon subunit [Candidatus Kentron sp. DK]VFJ53831.1 MAG: ATP synthase F1 subcomplex epsilon subunit [Candidatus Kentron sp. DK]
MNKEPQSGKKNNTIYVDVVSAEGTAFTGPARLIVAPAVMGAIGVLPGHSPLLTRLHPGEIRIEQAEGEEALLLYTSGGLMEVQPSLVTILSDTALRADAINEAAALAAKRHAEEAMLRKESSNFDYASAQKELAQALAQLKTLEDAKRRSRKGFNREELAHRSQ